MRVGRAVSRAGVVVAIVCGAAVASVAFAPASGARNEPATSLTTCSQKPWTAKSYQASTTPSALATMVFHCLVLRFPKTYRHDEVGLVALNSYPWFQNVNEFGLTSTTQQDLAALGMPPITLQDGPGGIITRTSPSPTPLPNELALGATFDTSEATSYGTVLGTQAHEMGYDGVQAPDLNLVRVPTWGRASESFGESPVLAGEMGGAEAVAIEAQHEIAVLKHFGPYSQETDRKELNQEISQRAYEEVYIRPFTLALRALSPQLAEGGHAVGIMCSYGNVNTTKACRSPQLAGELDYLGVNALVRSDLDVKVNPSALLLNGVDLVKPMDTGQLVAALRNGAVDSALDAAVKQVFTTEFAAGLVNGRVTAAVAHHLSAAVSATGRSEGIGIEQRAAVLLKDDGLLPLSHADGKVAVIGDATLPNTCVALASALGKALGTTSWCGLDNKMKLTSATLFKGLWDSRGKNATRTTTYVAPAGGTFVVTATTLGDTKVALDGKTIINTRGLAEFSIARTDQVSLRKGTRYRFTLTWQGAPPSVTITDAQPEVTAAVHATSGAKVAVVLAYDLAREGMDRSTLQLPGAQNAVISAIAQRIAHRGAARDRRRGLDALARQGGRRLEGWARPARSTMDRTLSQYAAAWRNLLDGTATRPGACLRRSPRRRRTAPWQRIVLAGDRDQRRPEPPPGPRHRDRDALVPLGGLAGALPVRVRAELRGLLAGRVGRERWRGAAGSVNVQDANAVPGVEVVQLYADFPTSLGEPRLQLVAFGTVRFTKTSLATSSTKTATLTVTPDALTVYEGATMRVEKGSYCLQASTYAGDPRSWTTGPDALGATPNGQVITGGAATLSSGSCPS